MRDDDQDRELGRVAAEVERASQQAQRYRPGFLAAYPETAEFISTGLRYRERGLFAATQLGKTEWLPTRWRAI